MAYFRELSLQSLGGVRDSRDERIAAGRSCDQDCTMTARQESSYRHINLILAAGGNLVQRNLFRTLALILSLAAILFPFLAALSISEGIKLQSRISVEEGADFYVTGDSAGSSAPLPLSDLDRFRKITEVDRIVPRVVGRAYLKERAVAIVGMPDGILPDSLLVTGGRPIKNKDEVVVGSTLGKQYGLTPGSKFYLPINRWKKFTVVGVFSSKCSMWSSSLIYMSLDDAGDLFRMKGLATDFLIYAKPKQSAVVGIYLQLENQKNPPIRIQSRELVNSYFQKGFESRSGVFTAFYLAAFALAIPLIFILAGLGWTERRKEIGTLKALGWQTLDVMGIVLWENVFVSVISACLALVTAYVWIRAFNGFFIAQFFIGESGLMPAFAVPALFIPVPAFISFILAFTLTMTGSLYNVWKMAAAPAAETMR
jgi:ABC-type lipoprotein release transport system permease subunit